MDTKERPYNLPVVPSEEIPVVSAFTRTQVRLKPDSTDDWQLK
jgi:hypothetical protein